MSTTPRTGPVKYTLDALYTATLNGNTTPWRVLGAEHVRHPEQRRAVVRALIPTMRRALTRAGEHGVHDVRVHMVVNTLEHLANSVYARAWPKGGSARLGECMELMEVVFSESGRYRGVKHYMSASVRAASRLTGLWALDAFYGPFLATHAHNTALFATSVIAGVVSEHDIDGSLVITRLDNAREDAEHKRQREDVVRVYEEFLKR